MGSLLYGGVLVDFDDRLLAHLQIVIVQKLRRGEGFLMSWRDATEGAKGYSAIWLHPAQHLFFKFDGLWDGALNEDWIDQLNLAANSSRGLLIMEEGSRAELPAES
jgi:hypothetical protein